MNQNSNNNENEIMDTGSQPRYPLAQAPGSEFQGMNYKDGEQNPSVRQQEAVTDAALQTTSEVTQTLINAGNTTSTLGLSSWKIAGGILSAISKILWRTIANQQQWEEMIDAVEILIKKALNQQKYEVAIAQLEGLQAVVDRYIKALDDLHANPTNQDLQNEVLMRWDAADTTFITAMPQFSPGTTGGESQILLLAVYAQAANLHLLLLRDAVQFGAQWGMDSATIETNYDELLDRLNQYNDYCVNTYNSGIQQSRNLQADLSNYDQYPWTRDNQSAYSSFRDAKGEYKGTENWNLYNKFRKEMTIMALDITSFWSLYNPYNYPLPVKTELTRELFTDIRGTTWRSDNNLNTIDDIEARMVGNRNAHLFTWLKQMNFYMKYKGKDSDTTHGNLMVGLEKTVQTTLGPDQKPPIEGQNTNYDSVERPGVNITEYYWNVAETKQWFETRRLTLRVSTGIVSADLGTVDFELWDRGHPGYRDYIYGKSHRSNSIKDHRLSWVKFEPVYQGCPFVWSNERQLSALLFGWTHNSVDPNNTIVTDQITQIPAVKAYWNRGAFSVEKGPGSTGGDLVKLSPSGEVSIKVRPSSPGKVSYRVRIRYAAVANGKLNVKKYVSSIHASITYDYIQTTAGNLTYSSFQYLDVYNFVLAESQFEVWLTNESGGPIYIDKIEFHSI
ncbi:insecticidal delta-endotoxin Cry8Ea1 family protein [Brevibacillus fortis]|nr:insecticidal delta-endotoxin Cry8Ea1 family protein [Brevibacillus fortis]